MLFGINGSEFIVLMAVAVIVVGPERLPHYAAQLTRLIRELRRMAQGAQEKVREELGPEFDDVDWRALDPRQYDPRRIVREALSDAIDLDDPLGLRAASWDKPVSAGGPGEVRPAADPGTTAGGESAGSTPAAADPSKPDLTKPARPEPKTEAFDPDAT